MVLPIAPSMPNTDSTVQAMNDGKFRRIEPMPATIKAMPKTPKRIEKIMRPAPILVPAASPKPLSDSIAATCDEKNMAKMLPMTTPTPMRVMASPMLHLNATPPDTGGP